MRKFPEIDRETYAARLARGDKFRDAALYEPDQAPRGTEFVYVRLSQDLVVLKRCLSRA